MSSISLARRRSSAAHRGDALRLAAATLPAPHLSFTARSPRYEESAPSPRRIRSLPRPAGNTPRSHRCRAAGSRRRAAVDRHSGRLALDVPQRDVDPGDRRHHLRGPRRAIGAGNLPPSIRARPRRGQREEFSHTATCASASMPATISPTARSTRRPAASARHGRGRGRRARHRSDLGQDGIPSLDRRARSTPAPAAAAKS